MAVALEDHGTLAYTTATTTRVMTTPASTAVGDVFHIQLTSRVSSTVTGLSGAQLLREMTQSGSSYGSVLLWTATTAGAQSVTFTLSAAGAGSVTWVRYSGVDSTDPVLADLQYTVASAEQWSTPTLILSEDGYVVGGMSIPSGSRIVTPITAGWTALLQGEERAGALFEYGAHIAGTVAAGNFVVDPSNFMTAMTYVFALRHADGGGGGDPDPGGGDPTPPHTLHTVSVADTSWLTEADGSGGGRWMKQSGSTFWSTSGGQWDGILPISSGQGHRFVTDLGDTDTVGGLVDSNADVRTVVAWGTGRIAVYRANDTTARVSTYTFDFATPGVYTPQIVDAVAPLTTNMHDDSPIAVNFTPNGHLWAARYQNSEVTVTKSEDGGATWLTPVTLLSSLPEPTGIVTLSNVGTTNLMLLASPNGSGQAVGRLVHQSNLQPVDWTVYDPPSVSPAEADDHISAARDGGLYAALKTSNPTSSDPLIYVVRWDDITNQWDTANLVMGPDTGDRPTRPALFLTEQLVWVVWGYINKQGLSYKVAQWDDIQTWSEQVDLFPGTWFSDGVLAPAWPTHDVNPMVISHDRYTGVITSVRLVEPEIGDGGDPGGGEGNGVLELSWAGIPQNGSFSATAKTDLATAVRLVVASNQALTSNRTVSANVTPDGNDWSKATVSGLPDGTWYYGWELDDAAGTVATPVQGSFTLGASSYRFAFGSCLESWSTANTFNRISTRVPDMFFHLGDFHYEDNTSTTQNDHLNDIEMQLDTNSGLRNLIASVPTIYVKSDHDAGGGNNAFPGSYTGPNRGAYKQAVPHPPLSDPNGLYYSFVVGRVRFIVTDARYLRSGSNMLGSTQMSWFLNQLSQSEPVKIWVQDSTFITNEAPEGEDKWSDYDNDRATIRDYVNANDCGQIITIHGDQHALAADDGSNNPWGGFPTFAAAPFGKASSHKHFAWSEGIWPTSPSSTVVRQYGIVDVTDTGGETITIDFTGYDSSDVARVTHTVVASVAGDPGGGGTTGGWSILSGGVLNEVEFLGTVQGSSLVEGELFPYEQG